jgi:hypothetical protein
MIAMYYMLKIKTGAVASPPTSIPAGLWAAVSSSGNLSNTVSKSPPPTRRLSQNSVADTGYGLCRD